MKHLGRGIATAGLALGLGISCFACGDKAPVVAISGGIMLAFCCLFIWAGANDL